MELHLFIIWKNAECEKQRIIDDISKRFDIYTIYEVQWSEARFSENMSRFYGQKLPPNSSKELHCGVGLFTVVVLSDANPKYEVRNTTQGSTIVNVNLFDAKTLYRRWTGGGHRIHATDNLQETNHDLVLLFGLTTDEFLYKNKDKMWDGKTKIIRRDLTGAEDWKSIEELFHVLNATMDYVVLRNFEGLPEAYNIEGHGDIDLLVSDYKEAVWITNAKPVFKESHRVHNHIRIGSKKVAFDFRFLGDNYYDERWELQILNNRLPDTSGLYYRPNEEDYFYSLLYHAIMHKPTISKDYIQRLSMLAEKVKIEHFDLAILSNPSESQSFMDYYMKSTGFKYSRPNDLSVYYKKVRSCPLPFIKHKDSIISTRFLREKDGVEYWSRVYDVGDKIYKQATLDLAERESFFLSQLNSHYFPRVLGVKPEGDYSVVMLEKIRGLPITKVKSEIGSNPLKLNRFFQNCLDILKELETKGITHRDIRQDNFLARGNKIVLIDFGWAISDTHPYFTPPGLGDSGRPPDGSFCDVYSMGRVFEQVNEKRYREFDLVIDLMTAQQTSMRITDLKTLKTLFAAAALSIGVDVEMEQVNNNRSEGSKEWSKAPEIFRLGLLQLLEQMSRINQQQKWKPHDECIEQLTKFIPPEDKFILVDEDTWGTDEFVAGRRCIPFLERDGQYWGPPPDDETAIREIERLRQSGANFMVFAWPALWFLDYYSGLKKHLLSRFQCVIENERLSIFDLRTSIGD